MTMSPSKRLSKIKQILADPFPANGLTAVESEIARLAARGWTIKEITAFLGTPFESVASTVKRVSRKTGLRKHELTRNMIERIERILAD